MRHRFFLLCTALLGLAPVLHAQPIQSRVIITEVMANPAAPILNLNGEWFEIYNALGTPINLQGWYVQDSAASGLRPLHKITSSLDIPGYGFVVLGNTTNTTSNGGVPVDYAYGGAVSLANSLDKIRIIAPEPAGSLEWGYTPTNTPPPESYVIDRAGYQNGTVSAKAGVSRYLVDVRLDNHSMDGSNWADALVTDVYGPGGRGTPGAQGTASLPVELVAFTAALDGRSTARLAWTTASETVNSGFQIEAHAPGADDFRRIAFVPGRGTTSETNRYDYAVENLAPGRHAFRLHQIDLDGTASVSPTVELVVGLDAPLTLETRGRAVHVATREAASVRVEAYDALGRRVAVLFEGTLGAGEAHSVELDGFAAGVYVVRALSARATASAPVVVR